ncbi:hypothetical protein GOC07_21265, partial [Sinorhizobium meliloti]|nr:hypothetical protein [Sinorhizobium meliloti]
RGRLFLGIGGRDHFGIRGRIASEFALKAFRHSFNHMDRSRASYRRRHRCSHSVKSSLRHTVPDPDAARRGLLVAYPRDTPTSKVSRDLF